MPEVALARLEIGFVAALCALTAWTLASVAWAAAAQEPVLEATACRRARDTEDVTSETFERALRYRDSFDPTKGEPVAWLIGIARRCIAAGGGTPDSPLDEAPDAALPGDLATEVAERVDLACALATLSERDRELIALRYGADLKARDIGRLLELRPNAVEVALHRSLQRLRRVLEQEPVRKPPVVPVPIADRLSTYREQGEPS